MKDLIEKINKMDKTYEMASGSAHFKGKDADFALVKEFRALPDSDKAEVAKHFESEFNKSLNYTYVGDAMSKFLKGV